MMLIDWVSPEEKKEIVQKIKDTFENRLIGRKISLSVGPLLILYWFPPWSLGPSTRGTPNHSFIFESFSFIGFIQKKRGLIHIVGISFYRIVFRFLVSLYIFAGLLLTGEINDLLFGALTFGLFGFFVWGIFEKSAEKKMNENVRRILEMDINEGNT